MTPVGPWSTITVGSKIVSSSLFCYTLPMKILVIGDTHGKLNKLRDVWPKLTAIDLIAHTGDHYSDALRIESEFGVPVIAVGGNCDGSGPESQIIETEYGNILLTHGHREGVKYDDLLGLYYRALEEDCRAVFFGHTHCSLISEMDGVHFVNPGSLTLPRDNKNGSYAIVRTAEDSFDASIVYYDTVMGSKSSPSGFIRSILNYSDRF